MSRPREGCVPGEDAAVLFAVLALERPTLPTVAAALSISRGSAWRRCLRARDRGLIDFEEGRRGTLKARYRVVKL
jgi:hypothetical protein